MRIATAKGLSVPECQILARVGYRKAREYLQSIGMAPKVVAAASKAGAKVAGKGPKCSKHAMKAMKAMKA